jgi:hypothetical protein
MLGRLAVVATVALLSGCDSTEPSPIAGTWNATQFIITESGQQPRNVLAAGGSLTIIVSSKNSTSGSLTIPASFTGGSAVTESMAGTATVNGNSVEFNQAADTFVRDLAWIFDGNTLAAAQTVSGVTLVITLTRQ